MQLVNSTLIKLIDYWNELSIFNIDEIKRQHKQELENYFFDKEKRVITNAWQGFNDELLNLYEINDTSFYWDGCRKEILQKNYKELLIQFVSISPDRVEKDFCSQLIKKLKEPNTFFIDIKPFIKNDFIDDELYFWQYLTNENKIKFEFSIKRKLEFLNQKMDSLCELSDKPDFFNSIRAYEIFQEYSTKHIVEFYTDYSFLFQNMKSRKMISGITHLDFSEWLHENKFITEKQLDYILSQRNLKTLQKSYSIQRDNNFNNIISKYD